MMTAQKLLMMIIAIGANVNTAAAEAQSPPAIYGKWDLNFIHQVVAPMVRLQKKPKAMGHGAPSRALDSHSDCMEKCPTMEASGEKLTENEKTFGDKPKWATVKEKWCDIPEFEDVKCVNEKCDLSKFADEEMRSKLRTAGCACACPTYGKIFLDVVHAYNWEDEKEVVKAVDTLKPLCGGAWNGMMECAQEGPGKEICKKYGDEMSDEESQEWEQIYMGLKAICIYVGRDCAYPGTDGSFDKCIEDQGDIFEKCEADGGETVGVDKCCEALDKAITCTTGDNCPMIWALIHYEENPKQIEGWAMACTKQFNKVFGLPEDGSVEDLGKKADEVGKKLMAEPLKDKTEKVIPADKAVAEGGEPPAKGSGAGGGSAEGADVSAAASGSVEGFILAFLLSFLAFLA